jgi:hypothetical protein
VICQKKLYGKRATAGGTPQTPSFGVTFADVYFGRDKAILQQRERIKRKTLEARRLHHSQRAALSNRPDEPDTLLVYAALGAKTLTTDSVVTPTQFADTLYKNGYQP